MAKGWTLEAFPGSARNLDSSTYRPPRDPPVGCKTLTGSPSFPKCRPQPPVRSVCPRQFLRCKNSSGNTRRDYRDNIKEEFDLSRLLRLISLGVLQVIIASSRFLCLPQAWLVYQQCWGSARSDPFWRCWWMVPVILAVCIMSRGPTIL